VPEHRRPGAGCITWRDARPLPPSVTQAVTFPHRQLLERLLARALEHDDGVSPERLSAAKARLGFELPSVVVDFYRLAGNAPELQVHNRLRDPEALTVEDGYLVFMEENQRVVDWGLRLPLDGEADPEVWQRVNGDEPAWYSETTSFSVFLVKNLAWTLGIELRDIGP